MAGTLRRALSTARDVMNNPENMQRAQRALNTAQELLQEEEQFQIAPQDFRSAKEQEGTSGTRIRQVTCNFDQAA